MFKKIAFTLTLLIFTGVGFSQLFAGLNQYPYLCSDQLCCPDTYGGAPWMGSAAMGPDTVQCFYYAPSTGTLSLYQSCSTKPCFRD